MAEGAIFLRMWEMWGGSGGGGEEGGRMGGMRGGLGIGGGVTSPPSLNSHLAARCRKISTETHNLEILEKSLYYLYLSISIGLDR